MPGELDNYIADLRATDCRLLSAVEERELHRLMPTGGCFIVTNAPPYRLNCGV